MGTAILSLILNENAGENSCKNQLNEPLEGDPIATTQQKIICTIPALAGFSRVTNNWLDEIFSERNGPCPWYARFPDLNPIDLFLWGHLKSFVYEGPKMTPLIL